MGKGSKNPKQEQHPPHEDHDVVDLHLGQSAEKTGKDQGNWSASEKVEESGGFWQLLLVFFTLVLTKASHSTLRTFLAKELSRRSECFPDEFPKF